MADERDAADDLGVSQSKKKARELVLLDVSAGRGTRDVLAARYAEARAVNQAAGGCVIAPWEVDDLPEEWVDMASALTYRLPRYQSAQKRVDDKLAAWRADHARRSARQRG